MRGWGIVLVIVGASQFVLPKLGYHHAIFILFGEYALHAAVGFIAAGALMVGASFRKKKEKK
jgi:hypothetical protein